MASTRSSFLPVARSRPRVAGKTLRQRRNHRDGRRRQPELIRILVSSPDVSRKPRHARSRRLIMCGWDAHDGAVVQTV